MIPDNILKFYDSINITITRSVAETGEMRKLEGKEQKALPICKTDTGWTNSTLLAKHHTLYRKYSITILHKNTQ